MEAQPAVLIVHQVLFQTVARPSFTQWLGGTFRRSSWGASVAGRRSSLLFDYTNGLTHPQGTAFSVLSESFCLSSNTTPPTVLLVNLRARVVAQFSCRSYSTESLEMQVTAES
jgi:hypothetical protein